MRTAIREAIPSRNPNRRPPSRHDLPKHARPVPADRKRRSTTIARVSAHIEGADFAEYFDALLKIGGLGNTELSAISGTGASLIGKWRNGTTKPTIDKLRPVADALGIPRVAMFVRAGLLQADDVDLPPVVAHLATSIPALPEEKRRTTEAHLQLIADAVDRDLAAAEEAAQRKDDGRRAG